jgi:ribosomal-protein-alanine N-acetyltransferase
MAEKEVSLEPFKTKNLIFRDLTMDDKYDISCLYSDPKVLRLDHREPFKNIKEAEELIRAFKQSNRNHSSISWGIELNETKKIIGTCGFKNWERFSHHADIGGNILSKHWSKGYGTETLKFMIKYGFTKMYLNKICAYTNVKNNSVVKLMKRHGFQQEGILREHQFLEGVFDDVFIFSLLKKDYKFYDED